MRWSFSIFRRDCDATYFIFFAFLYPNKRQIIIERNNNKIGSEKNKTKKVQQLKYERIKNCDDFIVERIDRLLLILMVGY